MNMNMKKYASALTLAFALSGAQLASAASLNGTFAQDNDVQFFTFTLSSDTNTAIATSSFVSPSSAGGFEPWIYLWDAYGIFVQQGGNVGTPGSSDSTISIPSLAAGTYYGALVVAENGLLSPDMPGATSLVTNFGDIYTPAAFLHSGGVDADSKFLLNQVNPTCSGAPALTSDYFVYDFSGCANRTGDWILDISAETPAALSDVSPYPATTAVPEPGTLALALAGLAGLAGFASSARRRNV